MHSIKIIEASISDLQALQFISIQTFSETFAEFNSEANMKLYIDKSFNLISLKAQLQNNFSKFYLVMDGEMVAGYLKINWGNTQSESVDPNALEIERIYVQKLYQGKNVGLALYQKALSVAKAFNFDFIWLGVWEKNQKAIRFYKKNGFVEFDKHLFKLGDDVQTDILMKFNLK